MKRDNIRSLCTFCLLAGMVFLLATGQSGNARASAAGLSPGQYLPIVVRPSDGPAGDAPEILSFTADPSTIESGDSSTLAWQVTGATGLSISPGIGAVTGASISVSPPVTTEYTLTATNAYGTDSAAVTVTVTDEPPPSGPDGFFIVPMPDIEVPSSHPTAKVDQDGGVHVAFTPQSAGDGERGAYYAYCPADCTGPSAFTIISIGEGVDFAAMDLTPDGDPRMLLRVPVQSGTIYLFQYWACDNNCTQPANWSGESIGYAYARPVGWVETFIHSFALDNQGRPRFVYYDSGMDYNDPHWGAFYAYCDDGCTSPANWYETRLLEDRYAGEFDLAFTPTGRPRLVYSTYDGDAVLQQVAYAECAQNCGNGGNWSAIVLLDTVSAGVSHFANFSLAVTSGGRARLALYTGTGIGGTLAPNTLYYLACRADDCMELGAWSVVDPGFPETHGEEGVSLALDEQNRPRLAYHAPLAAGFGLYYAWCDANNCEDAAQGWQTQEMEASEAVNEELPIPLWEGCPTCTPIIPPCTISTWDTGMRPSLALGPAGEPRIAYDADHEQGGACGSFTDTKLTRFIPSEQP